MRGRLYLHTPQAQSVYDTWILPVAVVSACDGCNVCTGVSRCAVRLYGRVLSGSVVGYKVAGGVALGDVSNVKGASGVCRVATIYLLLLLLLLLPTCACGTVLAYTCTKLPHLARTEVCHSAHLFVIQCISCSMAARTFADPRTRATELHSGSTHYFYTRVLTAGLYYWLRCMHALKLARVHAGTRALATRAQNPLNTRHVTLLGLMCATSLLGSHMGYLHALNGRRSA